MPNLFLKLNYRIRVLLLSYRAKKFGSLFILSSNNRVNALLSGCLLLAGCSGAKLPELTVCNMRADQALADDH